MLPKELNTLETFFKILDKFYPDWEKRADDYYLTEIAFLILKVFNSPYTDETIINNLRVMKVSKYNDELAKIYALPLEAYKWIMQNRMKLFWNHLTLRYKISLSLDYTQKIIW